MRRSRVPSFEPYTGDTTIINTKKNILSKKKSKQLLGSQISIADNDSTQFPEKEKLNTSIESNDQFNKGKLITRNVNQLSIALSSDPQNPDG